MRRFRSIEDVIWKAYTRALTPWFGVHFHNGQPALGRKTALFVCPPTQQGIAGGPWVPREVTNNQIHSIADQLLPCDSPVLMPEGSSYFRALRSYMAYVKLGGSISAEAQARLNHVQGDYMFAQSEYEEQKSIALANLSEDVDNKLPFDRWALKNAPDYIATRKIMRGAEIQLLRVQQEINGNIASIYSEDYKNLALAISKTPQPGFNMPCITDDINTVQADLHAATFNIPRPPPQTLEGTFYRPNYSLENYQSLVKDWVIGFETNKVIELKLDLKAAQSASWSQFGFDHTAEDNLKSFPLLGTSDSEGEGMAAAEEIDLNRPGSKIDIKITYRGLKLLNISPGVWDIPDVRRRYPNLCEGAPPDLIPSLVKAEKLLVGYGPGIEITFDSSTFDSAASIIQEAQNTGGGVSLLGFDIGGSDQKGITQTVPFESVKADTTASKISIPAVSDTFPVLVGVLARKL